MTNTNAIKYKIAHSDPYHRLLGEVMVFGREQEQRAKLSDGSRPKCLSLFGPDPIRYDLEQGFPIVTTKKLNFHAVAVELLWFFRGDNSLRYLHQHGVHIWDQWANENGYVTPSYGFTMKWPEQLEVLTKNIIGVRDNPHHPSARRLILSSWLLDMRYGSHPDHPVNLTTKNTPVGCHTLAQFDVYEGELSCHLYQRSGDLFLGVPFNIASYALLTHLLADFCGLRVGDYIHSFGNAHIYENHIPQVNEQLQRETRAFPKLIQAPINRELSWSDFVATLTPDSFGLNDYDPHPALRGEVAV